MTTENPLGLKRGTVELVDYQPQWAELFEQERMRLSVVIGNKVSGIEHIGSTSVPGLPAKPIIDIIASVESLSVYTELAPLLTAMGYEFMPERIFTDRVFFPKGPRDNRTHHLSLVVKDSPGWHEPLAFRDYLRRHPDAREGYTAIKQELARRYANDRGQYTAGKAEFIQKIMSATS